MRSFGSTRIEVYSTSEFRIFEGMRGSASQLPEAYLSRAKVNPAPALKVGLAPVAAKTLRVLACPASAAAAVAAMAESRMNFLRSIG
jgi:hypothetical protein